MMSRRQSQAGMTLIELLLAVTLFGAISASMGVVLNVAFTSMNKIDAKVDFNRRIIASQRVLDQTLQGLIPVTTRCGTIPAGILGLPSGMRFVSSYSLTEGARGRLQIVELFGATSPNGGFRLLLNERPYFGKASLTMACAEPFNVTPNSFVLADRLSKCNFNYRRIDSESLQELWMVAWTYAEWPSAVRIDMAPQRLEPNQIQPGIVFAPIQGKNINFDDARF